jgi:hypothetical protein
MLRHTGPGKVEIDTKYSSPGILKARLYNFDFDDMKSTALKSEHADFLTQKVAPLLASDRSQIWMQGTASRVGASEYNKKLSKVRAERVAKFLSGKGVKSEQMQTQATGEDFTIGMAEDDEQDRAVALIVLPKSKSAPPPPARVPTRPSVGENFKVAMLMGVSAGHAFKWLKYLKGKVGAGLAADSLFFIIWDTNNNLSSIYAYVGAGIGVGLTVLPKVSGTVHGPWNDFKTSAAISSAHFDGAARFTTIGAGNYTANWLNLLGTPSGVDPVYMMISTGTTIGAGASSTAGTMILLEGPSPFSGP